MARLVHTLMIATVLSSGCKDQAREQEGSDAKVYGGEAALKGDPLASYTAALVKTSGELVCTAVLISPQVLVTAAHCLREDITASNLEVVFGVEVKTGKHYPVKAHAVHPRYNPSLAGSSTRSQYDIGLIAMAQQVPDTFPISILEADQPLFEYSDVVKIAGYGLTDIGKSDAGILRYAPTNFSGVSKDTKEIFIDGFRVTNACGGDSGGPALVLTEQSDVRLLGVASYVITVNGRVCNSGFSSYSDLRAYRSWITQMVTRLPSLSGKVESEAPISAATGSEVPQ